MCTAITFCFLHFFPGNPFTIGVAAPWQSSWPTAASGGHCHALRHRAAWIWPWSSPIDGGFSGVGDTSRLGIPCFAFVDGSGTSSPYLSKAKSVLFAATSCVSLVIPLVLGVFATYLGYREILFIIFIPVAVLLFRIGVPNMLAASCGNQTSPQS